MPARKRTEQKPPTAQTANRAEQRRPTRDPVLKQLIAESPSFAEQHAVEAPAVRRVREKYEREILTLPFVESRLNKLEERGVNRNRVLLCLAALVQLENDATWKTRAETIKNRLKDLGERLGDIAGEVKEIYETDTIRPELWAMSLGVPCVPAPPYDHRKTVESMQETAADLESKAKGFGCLGKDITPAVKRAPVVALLRACKPQPWVAEFPPELRQQLAELLYAVCEKYGIKNSFTADSLFQTFKRHVLLEGSLPDKTHLEK